MIEFKPLNSRVLIKPLEEKETEGGIIIPDTAKEKPKRGEVLAVGPGKLLDDGSRSEMSVKPGDIVLFNLYSPDEFKEDGETYMVIDETSIMGILNKKNK